MLKIKGQVIDKVGKWCIDDLKEMWRYGREIYINKSEIANVIAINEEDTYNRNKTYIAYEIVMKNGIVILTNYNLKEVLEDEK